MAPTFSPKGDKFGLITFWKATFQTHRRQSFFFSKLQPQRNATWIFFSFFRWKLENGFETRLTDKLTDFGLAQKVLVPRHTHKQTRTHTHTQYAYSNSLLHTQAPFAYSLSIHTHTHSDTPIYPPTPTHSTNIRVGMREKRECRTIFPEKNSSGDYFYDRNQKFEQRDRFHS